MSSLQIYTWVGVPALTALLGIDRMDAWFDRVELRWDTPPGKANKLDIR